MRKWTLLAFVPLFGPVTFARVSAAPEPPHVTPVSWIVAERNNSDVDDKRVTLVGQVTQPDQGSDWWFTDGTGWVRLDTGDKDLPLNRRLVIRGRIDEAKLGIGYLEVEVKRWDYADSSR